MGKGLEEESVGKGERDAEYKDAGQGNNVSLLMRSSMVRMHYSIRQEDQKRRAQFYCWYNNNTHSLVQQSIHSLTHSLTQSITRQPTHPCYSQLASAASTAAVTFGCRNIWVESLG